MTCKVCGKHMLLSAEMCVKCENEVAKIAKLKSHYSQQRLTGYDLRYAILDLRREKLSLKTIAYILDKPVDVIVSAWEIILQDGE